MPLYITTGVNKKVKRYINLNQYRNWHYQVNNQIKQMYKDIAYDQLKDLKFHKKIKLSFVLWKRDKRKGDRANPLCIHEKFFCDALTTFECIPDDNDDFINSSTYSTGGIDRENPRVDILIEEI